MRQGREMRTGCGLRAMGVAAALAGTLTLAGCAALGGGAGKLDGRSAAAVSPPPDNGSSVQKVPATPVVRESLPAPITLAPEVTGAPAERAAAVLAPTTEPAAMERPAAIATPSPAPLPAPAPPAVSATSALPPAPSAPGPIACPPGSVGGWSQDLVKQPVYVCRRIGPAG